MLWILISSLIELFTSANKLLPNKVFVFVSFAELVLNVTIQMSRKLNDDKQSTCHAANIFSTPGKVNKMRGHFITLSY